MSCSVADGTHGLRVVVWGTMSATGTRLVFTVISSVGVSVECPPRASRTTHGGHTEPPEIASAATPRRHDRLEDDAVDPGVGPGRAGPA